MRKLLKNSGILFLLILITTAISAKAQQKISNIDTVTAKLSKALSVNPLQAAQIKNALSYGSKDLHDLQSNTSMDIGEKLERVRKLQALRSHLIDSVMTAQMKASYILSQNNLLLQKNQTDLNRPIPTQQSKQ